jgi:hypothetical protein
MDISPDVAKGLFGIGGAAIGAVIGAVLKGYFDAKSRDRRVLIATITTPTRLVVMAAHIARRVEIRVDGQAVPTIASCELRLTSAGNRAIREISLTVKIEGEADLISAEPGGSSEVEGLAVHTEAKKAVIQVPYINPGEEVVVRLFATGNRFSATPVFRQEEVQFISRNGGEPEVPNPLIEALFTAITQSFFLDRYFRLTQAGYRIYVHSLELKRARARIEAQKDEG